MTSGGQLLISFVFGCELTFSKSIDSILGIIRPNRTNFDYYLHPHSSSFLLSLQNLNRLISSSRIHRILNKCTLLCYTQTQTYRIRIHDRTFNEFLYNLMFQPSDSKVGDAEYMDLPSNAPNPGAVPPSTPPRQIPNPIKALDTPVPPLPPSGLPAESPPKLPPKRLMSVPASRPATQIVSGTVTRSTYAGSHGGNRGAPPVPMRNVSVYTPNRTPPPPPQPPQAVTSPPSTPSTPTTPIAEERKTSEV